MVPREKVAMSSGFRKVMTVVGRILVGAVLLAMTLWGVLAINYSDLSPQARPAVAAIFGAGALAVLWFVRPTRRAVTVFLLVFSALVLWWRQIPPRNDRDWQPNVAVLPFATKDGDRITLHNIRNCDYRTETDYTVRHYDRTVSLAKIRAADFYLVYWGSPMIAHTIMSFDFEGEPPVAFSIETRNRKGEQYDAIKGFFKQYELTYVMADERDVIRVRTNYRKGEDVYLFRLVASRDLVGEVFQHYLQSMNELKDQPQWYNALLDNCTTNIRKQTAPYNPNARLDWRIFANGHLDEFMYEQGGIDRSMPLSELKRRSLINPRAKAADADPDFYKKIREGLPGFEK